MAKVKVDGTPIAVGEHVNYREDIADGSHFENYGQVKKIEKDWLHIKAIHDGKIELVKAQECWRD